MRPSRLAESSWGEDQGGPIQDRRAGASESDHVGTVECCAGRLMPGAISSLSRAEANLTCTRICTRARERRRGDCRYRTGAEDQQATIRLCDGWVAPPRAT